MALVVAVACGLAATWAAEQTAETTWTAEGQYIVPIAPPQPDPLPGEPPLPVTNLPENSYDAGVLARTYEVVLEQDDLLLDAVAESAGLEREDVADGVGAVHLNGTHVIRVTFEAGDEASVQEYFASLSELVAQDSPTPNLPTGNLVALSQPSDPEESLGVAGAAPWVGVAVGLLLGWGAALLLDRIDRRVLGAGDVRSLAAWPVFDGASRGRSTPAVLESVVLRLHQDGTAPGQVAVVTAPGTRDSVGADTAEALAAAEARLVASGQLAATTSGTRWVPVGGLDEDGAAEREAQGAEAVVLSLPRRTSMRATSAALRALDDVGTQEAVVLVTPTARSGGVARDGATEAPAGTASPAGAHVAETTGPGSADESAASPVPGSTPDDVSPAPGAPGTSTPRT
ncbi:hypothetical protein J4G33_12655 [Actinotalea sp. BY-33]|uniref:Capsular polysaccharide biosynthesis protein n=1 Tax=Actinotalea soli TaxID=2819234 RepID=A0A939LQN6_9CELL|nr:hypothetical protein [Actinotalea soli]MBO1752656.1 hypothetical protein [Actinotalea soli]